MSDDLILIGVRVPKSDLARLDALRVDDHDSRSRVVRLALREYLDGGRVSGHDGGRCGSTAVGNGAVLVPGGGAGGGVPG